MQVTDSWNDFDSTGILLPLNALLNLGRLRPKRWFVILSMKKVENIAELNKRLRSLLFRTVNEYYDMLFELSVSLEINMFKSELYQL